MSPGKCKSSQESVTGGSHVGTSPSKGFCALRSSSGSSHLPVPSCSLPSVLHFLLFPLVFLHSRVFQYHPSFLRLLSRIPPPSSPPPSQAPGLRENPGQIFSRNATCARAGAAPARPVLRRFQAAQSRCPPGLGSCLGPLRCVSARLGPRVGVPGRRGWLVA